MENLILKACVCLCLCNIVAPNLNAYHEYNPMVVEGRRWNCQTSNGVIQYVIQGDTVLNDIVFKKVVEGKTTNQNEYVGQYFAAVREQDRKVFIVYRGQEKCWLLYDFTMGYGNNEIMVVDSCFYKLRHYNNRIIRGLERRYIVALPGFHESGIVVPIAGSVIMVEGVGSYSCPFLPHFLSSGGYVISCHDGDEEIFSEEDFFVEGISNGDGNGDGNVDISDVNICINMMLGKQQSDGWDNASVNIAMDDVIDISDVNAVINVMLGK